MAVDLYVHELEVLNEERTCDVVLICRPDTLLDTGTRRVRRATDTDGDAQSSGPLPAGQGDFHSLHIAVDPELHAWNMRSIAAFADGRTLNVWAAWGTLIRKRKYLPQSLTDIGALPELANVQWLGRGSRSKAGHPHHPLYARTDALLDAFHVSAYLATNPVATNRRSGFGQAMMDPRTTSDRRMKAQADALGSVGGPQ